MEDINEKINLIMELILNHSNKYNINKIDGSYNLIQDLEYNSINFIELIIDLENNFNIIFDEEMLIINELSAVENIVKITLNLIEIQEGINI